jgi:hypothetical protein
MNNNELINLYLDGSLNENQLKEFNYLLSNDVQFKKEFELYTLSIDTVKSLPVYSPSDKFTDNILQKLRIKNDIGSNFFKAIIIGFLLLFIFILTVLVNYSANIKSNFSLINPTLLQKIKLYNFTEFLKSENVLIIISSITLILLIGIYYIQNNFSKLKKQII